MKNYSLRKKLKRWGNNLIVSFTLEEEEIYGLRENDYIDISDMLTQKHFKNLPKNQTKEDIKKEVLK